MPASTLPASTNIMSLREKIAQLIFVRLGSNMPPVRTADADEDRVRQLLESVPVGGLIVFNGNEATKDSLERLQSASAVPLLVASDIERGAGQQIKGLQVFPHAMAFEKLLADAETAVAEYAHALARDARSVGIHIACAPVADVSTNPRNPIISIRAFSTNAKRAAALTAAYVAAAESAGLFTTPKHFPGHGDTHLDSHNSLPIDARSLDELKWCELIPFQAAIDAGCSMIMTAHVAYPAIDPSGMPATLSSVLLRKVLRQEMGFQGAVVSDSLLMAGVRDRFPTEAEVVCAAIAAGVDLQLDVRDPVAALDYVQRSVETGLLDERLIDEALARVWLLKQRMFDGEQPRDTVENNVPQSSERLAQRIARGAIQIIGGDRSATLPFDPRQPLTAIFLKPFETAIDPIEQPLAVALRRRFEDVRYVQLGPSSDAAAIASAMDLARQSPQVLIAALIRPAAWHAFGLLPAQDELVKKLTSQGKVVLAALGVEHVLADYPNASLRICTYSDVPVSQQALADFLVEQ